MALNDAAVLIPGTGFMYLAPAETVQPASLTAPAAPWVNLGHTSREDGRTNPRDGGDSETLGTWQNTALRERRDPTTFAITAFLHQVDNSVLELYFGPGDIAEDGEFGVQDASATTEKALFVRIVDGANQVGLYLPKVSIGADDDVEVDVENFLAFPVRATVLQVSGSNLMTFFGTGLGTPA
ncbi:MAG: hypothetical protein L0I24_05045 [Pseudonocardia sp.]|nr:hypothetical protein [Pseudonocardia sp.]